ncbi:MAG TPA: xanthine dehydrogenase family protein molybdopterin-binding subunit [bacterium]|nr:xanthine dehydrogenase family protein molybdopterin-binding subunit [bacterium]
MDREARAAVGRPMPVVDSPAKSAGRLRFLQDLSLPGMLHAKMVLAGRPHAMITSIETARARGARGVIAVATALDVPGQNRVGVVIDDQPLFADLKVRYEGDCVAAIAAETLEAAEAGAALVEVRYEELPTVASLADAAGPGAVPVHEGGNLAVEHTIVKGDVARGEAECTTVVEGTYVSPVQEHAYLETVGGIAIPKADGSVEVLTSTQCPFYVRDAVARCLGLALSKVRVVELPVGGGFGGKEDVPSEICARVALLAVLTRRPVKLVLTREEDIAYSSKRHPMEMDYRLGCDRQGLIRFADVRLRSDVGAYATLSPIVLFRSAVHASGPYSIPHVRIKAQGFYSNTAPKGAMRGFGTPQVVFGCEAAIEQLAASAGIDSLRLRRRNALKSGDQTATGQVLEDSVGFIETLDKAAEVIGGDAAWDKPRAAGPGRVRARGVASMFYGVSLGAIGRLIDKGAAKVEVLKDGSVSVFIGCTDMGQGALTVITQIAADALGIAPEKITVNRVDTHVVPDSGPTVASRATVMSGNAVVDACARLRARMLEVASAMLGGPVVHDAAGGRISRSDSGTSLTMAEVIKECHARRVELATTGWYKPPDCLVDKSSGQGRAYYVYSFATDVADVEVDTETGHVDVVGLQAIHDSGRIVNPLTASGQVEGGIAQGIGLALRERFSQAGGRVTSTDLATYLVPTALDLSDNIGAHFVERPSKDGPFGAKGLGEPAIIPVAAAIANAVSNAVGTRVTSLPIDPEWVVAALRSCGV